MPLSVFIGGRKDIATGKEGTAKDKFYKGPKTNSVETSKNPLCNMLDSKESSEKVHRDLHGSLFLSKRWIRFLKDNLKAALGLSLGNPLALRILVFHIIILARSQRSLISCILIPLQIWRRFHEKRFKIDSKGTKLANKEVTKKPSDK